ncbi:MAG: hypothetical protein WC628_03700 [Candidatus Omnitrophota bacterium]
MPKIYKLINYSGIAALILSCFLVSGCATLAAPFQLAGGILDILGSVVGSALNIAKDVPLPPPWLFL